MAGGEKVLTNEVIMGELWETIYGDSVDPDDRETTIVLIRECYEATCFILGAREDIFGDLKKKLEHSTTVNRDEYTRTLQSAYEMLKITADNQEEHKQVSKRRSNHGRGGGRFGRRNVNFAQGRLGGQAIAGTDGILHSNVKCYKCNRLGRYKNMCPQENNEDENRGANHNRGAQNEGENVLQINVQEGVNGENNAVQENVTGGVQLQDGD